MLSLTPRLAKHVGTLHQAVRQHCAELERAIHLHCDKAQTNLNTALKHADIHPKAALYAGLLLVTCIWLSVTLTCHLRTRARNQVTPPDTPNLEKRSPFKAPDRPPGGTSTTTSSHHIYANVDQYGHRPHSPALLHLPTQIGPSKAQSLYHTARSVMAQSTTLRWAFAPCTGTSG